MDRAARARDRRRLWSVEVVTADDDPVARDVKFWQRAPVEARLRAVAELVELAWTLEHGDEPLPRSARLVAGVRRRRG